ncbi:MAG: hypothetical protein P4M07_14005 [Xanthobacteraceae bacterium]|nr:hypothetical protein [Xanthobacteraceae bacterium]
MKLIGVGRIILAAAVLYAASSSLSIDSAQANIGTTQGHGGISHHHKHHHPQHHLPKAAR